MPVASYAAWAERSWRAFAGDLVATGAMPARDAVGYAEQQLDVQLPLGLETPGQLVYVARLGHPDGEDVGHLWLRLDPSGAYVMDVAVEPAHRGAGLGRAVMLAGHTEVTRRGLSRVRLTVLGENAAALALYHSVGYRPVETAWTRRLAATDAPTDAAPGVRAVAPWPVRLRGLSDGRHADVDPTDGTGAPVAGTSTWRDRLAVTEASCRAHGAVSLTLLVPDGADGLAAACRDAGLAVMARLMEWRP